MKAVSNWIRKIHRWLAIPLFVAVAVLLISTVTQGEGYQSPGWLNVIAIGSILSLLLTGLYMFVQHYAARWRRSRRMSRKQAGKAGATL
jgi:uncharacterized iron-regulated membrane protein